MSAELARQRQTLNGQTLCHLSEHLHAEETSQRDFWQHFLTDLKEGGSYFILCFPQTDE